MARHHIKHLKHHIHHHKNKVYILLVLLALLGAGWSLFTKEYEANRVKSYEVTKVTYECPDNKSIISAYSGDIVDLDLSDGRKMVLNRMFSSGLLSSGMIKYANKDDNFVFWTRGKTAFIQEARGLTYQNCTPK